MQQALDWKEKISVQPIQLLPPILMVTGYGMWIIKY